MIAVGQVPPVIERWMVACHSSTQRMGTEVRVWTKAIHSLIPLLMLRRGGRMSELVA